MSFTSGADVLSGLPGAFQAALHGALTAKHYEQAVRDTMSCGGCTSSRGSFIGACLGAQVGLCANLTFIIINVMPACVMVYKMGYFNSHRLDLREFQLPGHPKPCAMSPCWSMQRR